ncbi:hypothetical protein ScalyP_jg1161, partial [Parmales sp. scaly parma]
MANNESNGGRQETVSEYTSYASKALNVSYELDPVTKRVAHLATITPSTVQPPSGSLLGNSRTWRKKQRLIGELEQLLLEKGKVDENLDRVISGFQLRSTLGSFSEGGGGVVGIDRGESAPRDEQAHALKCINTLNTSQTLTTSNLASRKIVHPVTKGPRISTITGPAAPPAIRLINERLKKEQGRRGTNLNLNMNMNMTESLEEFVRGPETQGSSDSDSPTSIINDDIGEFEYELNISKNKNDNEEDSLGDNSICSDGSTIDASNSRLVGMAAALAIQSWTRQIMNLTIGAAASVAKQQQQQQQQFTPLDRLSQARAQTAPYMKSYWAAQATHTAAVARWEFQQELKDSEQGRGMKKEGPIIDREVCEDKLFAKLMGEEAEIAARPRLKKQPPPRTSKGSSTSTSKDDENGLAARIKKASGKGKKMPPLQMELRTGVRINLEVDGTLRPCNPSDPYPLMPSCVPPLHLTRFAEPTRDRDKEWRLVSQREILGTEIDVSIGTIRREREAWRGRFFPKSPSTNGAALAVGAAVPPPRIPLVPGVYPPGGISSHSNVYSPEAGSLISRERLGRQAVQISRSYAILTAYGMGISGRVYAPGLHIH